MDFIDITEKMEKYYQEQYNAEQRKFIFDTFKNMTKINIIAIFLSFFIYFNPFCVDRDRFFLSTFCRKM